MPKRFEGKKECTKCREIKPYEEFPISRTKPDGYAYSCKECCRKDSREYYERCRTKVLKRQRKYDRSGRKKYRPDPIKERARVMLRYAITVGRIERGKCIVGKDCRGRIEAHHHDYLKPLDVKWLCQKHHLKLHRLQKFGIDLTTNEVEK